MKLKKKLLVALIAVLSVALVITGVFLLLRLNRDPVLVVPVGDVSTSGDFYGGSTLYGFVRTDNIQAIFLSETQTVTNIHVSEGDEVKVGDPLLDYDTSLTDLQLQRKALEIQKQERALEKAQKDYKALFGKTFSLPEPSTSTDAGNGKLSFYQTMNPVLHLLTQEETQSPTAEHTESTEEAGTEETAETEPIATEPIATEPIVTEPIVTEPIGTEPTEPEDENIVVTYRFLGGKGTEEEPYLYIIADDFAMEPELLQTILGERESANVVFAQCMDNRVDGIVASAWGMVLERTEEDSMTMRLADASAYVGAPLIGGEAGGEEPIIPGPGGGGGMSYEELQKLRMEKEREMIEMDLNLRMARVEYKRMQTEMGDGTIYAELDGVVQGIGDPETAYLNGEAVLKVSGGGGYLIEGTISELSLNELMVGRAVSVTSWNNGMTYDGVITNISNVPSTSGGWSDGNNNVSYYPFTVMVDDSAELMDGEYVEMSLAGEGEDSGFYLEKPFVLQESGKSYVYVVGENGRLEKREVASGRDLWGSYLEILSGLTPEDKIAFPYGKNVSEGAKITEGTVQDLYGW